MKRYLNVSGQNYFVWFCFGFCGFVMATLSSPIHGEFLVPGLFIIGVLGAMLVLAWVYIMTDTRRFLSEAEEKGNLERVCQDFQESVPRHHDQFRMGNQWLYRRSGKVPVPYGDIREAYVELVKRKMSNHGSHWNYLCLQVILKGADEPITLCEWNLRTGSFRPRKILTDSDVESLRAKLQDESTGNWLSGILELAISGYEEMQKDCEAMKQKNPDLIIHR